VNRIYKAIWNEVLVTLVSVSEFVKGKTKIFLRLSQSKTVKNVILVSRVFSQFFKQTTLVATMNSFTNISWVANGININDELDNGCLYLAAPKEGVCGKKIHRQMPII
jgi:hypothetical protein